MHSAPLLLLLALATGTSGSKLGPHLLGNVNDSGAVTLLDACPKVAKWLTPDGSVAASIRSYRNRCPCGTTVLRVYVDSGTHYSTSQDAAGCAADFWSKMQPGLTGIPVADVDWLEGPNELDNLEDWYHDWGKAQWFAAFWSALADHMNAAGYRPLVGSIAVGNPALAGENGPGSLNYFKPVADVMKQKSYPWGWSYHSYSQVLSTDVGAEIWLSLRYRTIRDECGLQGVPLVLTEGGRDFGGGWQGYASGAQYMDWLRWHDARMQEDSEVVGVTLFQVGEHGGWQSFDLGPVADDLAAHLNGIPGPADCHAPGPDAGVPPQPGPDAGGAAATMAFLPAQPVEGSPFQIVVSSPNPYTNVALTGVDPTGAATSQSGPAIAPAYSWTWTLTSASIVGAYHFSFAADQVPAGQVEGTVIVSPRAGEDASTPNPPGEDAAQGPAGEDVGQHPGDQDAAAPGAEDAALPATGDASPLEPGWDAAASAAGDAGHAAPSPGFDGSCGCGTEAPLCLVASLAGLLALRRRRPARPSPSQETR